jgi:hypothetical protein
MGSFSDYLENAVLNHVFKNTALSQPSNLYIALCTVTVTDSMTGSTITEPSGNAYARTLCNGWTVSSGSAQNSGTVTFPTASGSWGTILDVAICDASSGGNVIAYGTLTSSRSITTNDVVVFNASQITVSLS